MIETTVKTKLTPEKVKRKAKAANITSLKDASSYLAKVVRSTVRRGKKPSKPGRPPNTRSGNLKRMIVGVADAQRGVALIGPRWTESSKSIWHVLEAGGETGPTPRQLKQTQIQVGRRAPIAVNRFGKVVRIKIKTAKQAELAERIIKEANAIRGSGKRYQVAARPFVGPSFEKSKNKLPAFWSGSVQ